MNRIFLTGDTHSDITRILNFNLPELDRDDVVIVLGDFGIFWDSEERAKLILELLKEKNFTIAFVDGNHENFNLIKQMEDIAYWNDGYVGRMSENVVHLLRGEIYNIGEKRIGVMGGANSIDKWHRTENVSWWKAEEITDDEIDDFRTNLTINHVKENNIDIMLSHDAPLEIIPLVKLWSGVNDGEISKCQEQLEKINKMANITKWYFGHWHIDKKLNNKFECLYKTIKEV